MTRARAFFVVFCLVVVAFGAIPSTPTTVDDTTNNTTTITPATTPKQSIENTQSTFEEQLRKEISDKLRNEHNISYDFTNQALKVDIIARHYTTGSFSKFGIWDDTTDVLKIAATHPDKIKFVDVNYRATLLDQNRNEIIDTVYVGHYSTTSTCSGKEPIISGLIQYLTSKTINLM
jgi:hypothetical protein